MKTIEIKNLVELSRTDFSVKIEGENGFILDLSWSYGGKAGGEYLDTFSGLLTLEGEKYKLYKHWSYGGHVGIYENEKRIGEYVWENDSITVTLF